MNITRGQYKEGQNVTLHCEVPSVKGNISSNNLQAYIGNSKLFESSIDENLDATKRLLFHQVFNMRPEYHNTNVSCVFFSPPYGDVQKQLFLLELATCECHLPLV